jgi:hypothetical protein
MKHFIAVQKRAGALTPPQRWRSMRVNLARSTTACDLLARQLPVDVEARLLRRLNLRLP